MLTYDDALNLNYYKKTSFTGWMGGMRFKIAMEKPTLQEPSPDGAVDVEGKPLMVTKELPPLFHVWIWPGPFIFDLRPKDETLEQTFPFGEDGKKQAVDYINETFCLHEKEWGQKKLL